MTVSIKQLAEEVRKVYSPPGGRAWSLADVAIVKLLKAIEEQPAEVQRPKTAPNCNSTEHGHCTRCGHCEFGGQCICYAR